MLGKYEKLNNLKNVEKVLKNYHKVKKGKSFRPKSFSCKQFSTCIAAIDPFLEIKFHVEILLYYCHSKN